jgi:hypothetical protein
MALTNAGKDFIAAQVANCGGSPSASKSAKYIALTANTNAASVTSTSLTGEITTAGLARQAATTLTHTAGSSTYQISAVFTVVSADISGGAVAVYKMGVFNDTSANSGVLVYETVLGSTATLSAVGDQLTVQQTVTIS